MITSPRLEKRYIVVKIKDLGKQAAFALRRCIDDYGIATVDCVVVEADDRNYSTVVDMVVTNNSNNAHCPNCGICHTSEETCNEAKTRFEAVMPNYQSRLPEQPKPRPYDYAQAPRHGHCNHGPELGCGRCAPADPDGGGLE